MTTTAKYLISHSTNGIITTIEDQFAPARFESELEARSFAKHILKCQAIYGYSFEKGSSFQVITRNGEESKNVGRKIIA